MSCVFIISAPSGSGKSTLVRELLRLEEKLVFSVSYTTRQPRGQESQGDHYQYVTRELFMEMLNQDAFLEWAEVFGNFYGTHRSVWDKAVAEGKDLLLDIDVQGAQQLKLKIPDAVTIFVLAPSRAILEQRLRARSEDAEAVIQRRLAAAANEIRNYHGYDYVIINDQVTEAVSSLRAVLGAERVRRQRMEDRIRPILETFGELL